ncbi:MAG TPA: DUF447 domain-containing protein [Anaerolineaceae bacterium]|nr:DUF447 domain-containing protein [Anaerolineaceae bacterium]
MIIETIFSSLDPTGQANFAPMGIRWGEDTLVIRPFRDTVTYRNLVASRYGVVNLTDDVLPFVQTALYDAVLPHFSARVVPGVVFKEACSWREVEVVEESGTVERAEVVCRVVYRGWQREILGFCRAKNAVLEATIKATRLHLNAQNTVDNLEEYRVIVEKTGGETEKKAFEQVCEYIQKWTNKP